LKRVRIRAGRRDRLKGKGRVRHKHRAFLAVFWVLSQD